jgi:glycosyltransferase involved in cell wall biosynthesis
VPNRVGSSFLSLIRKLEAQIQTSKSQHVEILGLFDNKKRTVGEKRDALLQISNGKYVVFIDDDDRVAETYVSDILASLTSDPDCVVFDCICTMNGKKQIHCKYGIEFEYKDTDRDNKWFGKPAHTMVYRSAIAKKHRYASISDGEDVDWVKRASKEIKKQNRISKVLYFYDFNQNTSETRGPRSSTTVKNGLISVHSSQSPQSLQNLESSQSSESSESSLGCSETFWNDKHSTTDRYWLTGSSAEQVLGFHQVVGEFHRCKSFLDIGVGFGGMSRHAKSKGKYVVACDISMVALQRLKGIASETHMIVQDASPVDLAVCHLVFQHCDDIVVSSIIKEVKLTPQGIFSFQFACLRDGEVPNRKVASLIANRTHFFRDLETIQRFIREGNKEVVSISPPKDFFADENLRWFFCKVRNQRAKVEKAPQEIIAPTVIASITETGAMKSILKSGDAMSFFETQLPYILRVKKLVKDLDPEYMTHQCFNALKHPAAISIVMTSRNRSAQTYFTLRQIQKQFVDNIQVILVDDSNTDIPNEDVLRKIGLHIDFIKIRKKFWINPCVNYNIGFQYIKSDKTIIQNSEVCHIGRVLNHAIANLKPKTYLVFNVMALTRIQENNQLQTSADSFMRLARTKPSYPWYQHHEKRNAHLHFLSAIMTDDLKHIEGFDLDYSMATCFDDPALVDQLKNINMTFVSVPDSRLCLMGIHQWHQTENPKMTTSNVFNQNLLFAKRKFFEKNARYPSINSVKDISELFQE